METQYVAVIETGGIEGYSVFFPDFPGLASAGDTPEEAIDMAREALQGHIEVMADAGEVIPPPTAMADIKVDDDIEVFTLALIGATVPGRSVRVQITMDELLLKRVDAVSTNRSGFLAESAKEKLALMGA